MEETTRNEQALGSVTEQEGAPAKNDDWISYVFFGVVALIGGACYLLTGWWTS